MRQFLKFTSSATSGIFQSPCLCSLCKIIETTHRIEVSGLNALAHYIHIHTLMSHIARNTFSLLRSKIRELHLVHRASLEALLRHLLRVASHSDKNAMTVEALAAQFCYTVLRGNIVLQDGVHVKACCDYLLNFFPADPLGAPGSGGSHSKCAYPV